MLQFLFALETPEESDICSPGCSETESGVKVIKQDKAHPHALIENRFCMRRTDNFVNGKLAVEVFNVQEKIKQ